MVQQLTGSASRLLESSSLPLFRQQSHRTVRDRTPVPVSRDSLSAMYTTDGADLSPSTDSRQVVFVDRAVDNHVFLLTGIPLHIPVVALDPRRDSLGQITHWLHEHPVDTVHIFAHGAPGTLAFGDQLVTENTLQTYRNRLKRWFTEPSAATVVLYSCEVGAGVQGRRFLERLHQLTGASIAAASHRVGASYLGGSWELDVAVGTPRFEVVVNAAVRSRYGYVLAPPVLQSISSLEGNGTYSARTADTILSLAFTFDQGVTFTANGGALAATLSNGAIAQLTANASGSTLTVDYPIQSGDDSVANLSVTSLALTGGATLTNGGGEAANLALPSGSNLGNTRNLEIDNTEILVGDITLAPAGNVPVRGSSIAIQFGDRLRQTDGAALPTDLTGAGIVSVRRASDNVAVPLDRVTFDNTGQQTITVVPSGTLDPSTTYRVDIADNRLEDDGANELTVPVRRDFTTQAGDITPPRVTFLPPNGSTLTDPNANLTVDFNEPIR
ncbi:MAG: DUF4347 domain-containing protein, partial [Cyanobacteria bacterium P01_H01_bin.130]